jgi:acyl-[acyl-carrier-protein]-phospholipid O-acyltransferase / long-chain-fatty-acid--[acyl-carrier-protein] ligase
LWMDKFGIRILEGYGTTEASPGVAINTPMHCKLGTVGQILPDMRFTIEPVEGITKGGKLLISGPNIMLGYLRPENPGVLEPTAHIIDGELCPGWYDTGDIVDVDEDRYITILGRAKRFAKLGGEMVSLAAIEEAIAVLWPEHLHAAITVEDPQKGESVMLFTQKSEPSRNAIIKFFSDNGYSELYIPKTVQYIAEMPLLGSGKIDYMTLKNSL